LRKTVWTEIGQSGIEFVLGVGIVLVIDFAICAIWKVGRIPVDSIFATVWMISLFNGLRDRIRRLESGAADDLA
jgi:hypothetical protein